jgi:transcriptional regulator with XRE-family HTH domain
MSAQPIQRPTIRCRKCGLNQFTRTHCRRCGTFLECGPVLVLAEALLNAPRPKSARRAVTGQFIGRRVFAVRTRLKLSQRDLARRMGNCARSYISKVERGYSCPTRSQLMRLAVALECDPLVLFPPTPEEKLIAFMFEFEQYVPGLGLHERNAVLREADELAWLSGISTAKAVGE